MNPRLRAALQLLVLVSVVAVLALIFPGVMRFIEAASRELRYLWWLVLLIALASWLIWSAGRRPK